MLDKVSNTQWIQFQNSSYYHMPVESKSDLTVLQSLFKDYSNQLIWKFELVTYTTSQNISSFTSLIVYVNQPPVPGTCEINPQNGTTNTLFTIYCTNWTDYDGRVPIYYSFYGKM